MLLATMTTTPGLPTLHGVEVEKKAILERLPATLNQKSMTIQTLYASSKAWSIAVCILIHGILNATLQCSRLWMMRKRLDGHGLLI